MNTNQPSHVKTSDETEQEQVLHDLLLHEAAPLIRTVLRQRLGLYVNPQGANPQQPDAENLYQDILIKLLQRSQDWLADAEQNAIHNYRNLVITIATNACHDYLRAKAPNRARLKNRLRTLCSQHRDFKLWEGDHHEQLCGFAVWQGKAKSSEAMQQIRQWQTFPDSFTVTEGDVHRLSFTNLVAEVLQQAGGPVELEDLTKLLTTLLRTEDHPLESLEQEQEACLGNHIRRGVRTDNPHGLSASKSEPNHHAFRPRLSVGHSQCHLSKPRRVPDHDPERNKRKAGRECHCIVAGWGRNDRCHEDRRA